MFKDKDKQREANAERQRRYKAKQKALPEKGVTDEKALLPEGVTNKALPNIPALNALCDKADAMMGKPKRGKDIKAFEDLSPSIQRVIDVMSTTDGKLDKTIKANRTAIAVAYQHLFPDRYHSTGIA